MSLDRTRFGIKLQRRNFVHRTTHAGWRIVHQGTRIGTLMPCVANTRDRGAWGLQDVTLRVNGPCRRGSLELRSVKLTKGAQ